MGKEPGQEPKVVVHKNAEETQKKRNLRETLGKET